MAFSYTILGEGHAGNLKIVTGTWTSGSTTGGDIKTGLQTIYSMQLTANKSAVTTNGSVVYETFPLNTDGVTIITDSGVDGVWTAFGI